MTAPVTSDQPYPKRGDVYLVQLDKRRPALIISIDALNRHALDVCVVPITSVERKTFSLRIPLRAGEAGLHSSSWAKCDQVTTLDKSLLVHPPIGRLSGSTLRQIEQAIKLALDLT